MDELRIWYANMVNVVDQSGESARKLRERIRCDPKRVCPVARRLGRPIAAVTVSIFVLILRLNDTREQFDHRHDHMTDANRKIEMRLSGAVQNFGLIRLDQAGEGFLESCL